jgi:hypothetical protein
MHTSADPTASSHHYERPVAPAAAAARTDLHLRARVPDRVLELLGRRRLSAIELRVLLGLLDRGRPR